MSKVQRLVVGDHEVECIGDLTGNDIVTATFYRNDRQTEPSTRDMIVAADSWQTVTQNLIFLVERGYTFLTLEVTA